MSPNIIEALKVCSEMGIPFILFTGKDGCIAKSLATYCIIAPGNSTAIIQEIHILMKNTFCQSAVKAIFN
jgi:D-sedoheptulose 7-phosphate isomerase